MQYTVNMIIAEEVLLIEIGLLIWVLIDISIMKYCLPVKIIGIRYGFLVEVIIYAR